METVSFEIAKKLKEKGFDKYCCRAYNEIGCFNDTDTYKDSEEFYCYAPQISQVLKWLREENIHLYTDIDNEGWFFEIKCLKTRFMINTDFFKRYNSYELAALAGIEYVVDNNLI